jgi:hypothetical protein
MPRPEFVTNEDLQRWSDKIDNDPLMSPALAQSPLIREVCLAGRWLNEKLIELDCPDHIIGCIMYTAGEICFGRSDPWKVHQDILDRYVNNTLVIDPPDESN